MAPRLRSEEAADHVSIRTRNVATGEEKRWRATYLIAADGAASQMRRDIGLSMIGPACLAVMSNDYWHGDMSHFARARDIAGCRVFLDDPSIPSSTILNTNGRDRWLSMTQIGGPRRRAARAARRRPRPSRRIRKQTGIPGLPMKMINRSVWRMSRQVAENVPQRPRLPGRRRRPSFPADRRLRPELRRAGRPQPRLEAASRAARPGPDRLLDSYDVERRPVAQSNADFSVGNRTRFQRMEQAIRSGNDDESRFWINDFDNHLHSIGQALGLHLRGRRAAARRHGSTPVQPRALHAERPAGRTLPAYLARSRAQAFDARLVRPGLTWSRARRAGMARGRPRRVGQAAACRSGCGSCRNAHPADGIEMGSRGAVLVRPDGHVAWRSPYLPADPERHLQKAIQGLFA